MAVSVDWPSGVISVNKVDMTLIQSNPTVIYQHDLAQFWRDLRALEDSEAGRPFPLILEYNQPQSVGGVELAAVLALTDYYTVTYEDDQYAVNLVGMNSNVGDRVNVNQVSIRSGNSAGLVQSSQIASIAYLEKVVVDKVNGEPGSISPIGTAARPVNNVLDADIIAHNNNLNTFLFPNSTTLISGDDFGSEPHIISGASPQDTVLTVQTGANVTNVDFRNCYLIGDLDAKNTIRDSIVGSITKANGFIYNCALVGPIQANANLSIQGCWNVAGTADDVCIIDFNGLAIDIDVTGLQSARIKAINMVTGSSMYCGGDGDLEIDASCTGGTLRTFGAIHRHVNGTLDNDDNHNVSSIVMDHNMTEAYPVDGQSSQSPAALLYAINQMLSEFQRTGTTVSVKKRDGTEAFQIELDSATAPTSATQSS